MCASAAGATCHMCNNDKLFTELRDLRRPLDVTLGDGHNLKASGKGTVLLQMSLHDGTMRKCSLNDVLYDLAFLEIVQGYCEA